MTGFTIIGCLTLTVFSGAGQTPASIAVTSPAFKHGQPLPVDYTADGKNISPPLMWTNLPAGTKEIAVIHEDPTAPTPQPFVHWVIYKIPGTAKGLPENISADPAVAWPADLSGAVQGVSGFRRPGYRGPAPPKPGRVHEYHFIVYALDAPLEVSAGLTKAQLLDAMKGHIIGQGEMVGTYERKPPGGSIAASASWAAPAISAPCPTRIASAAAFARAKPC